MLLEYQQGTFPMRARSGRRELEHRLAELPSDRRIVACCRGPYCVFSHEAAQLLQTHGFSVRRFEAGLPEWPAAGLPVAAAPRERPDDICAKAGHTDAAERLTGARARS